ncbi:MAG: hypothetical protein KJ970_10930 [Candidatus Eisenbacteria bacterium]|uniref:DNA 5'-3' helicase n=1 Tax=Eiseniibacteriota bacterium TaxID=2212470 RepID=A0A948S079_UNCEI|nr:hypothetical protein [Candidatus Eisenbacteria bacterium]
MKNQRFIQEVFQENGVLARVISGYEWRPEQTRLAQRVMETFDRTGILIAEAPTGIGKSLAYLVPAAQWALKNGPVIVSSYTKTLQDQIIKNDAPLLSRLVHPDLRVAVLKGRGNYLCRRRWEIFRQEEGSSLDGQYLIQRLEGWVKLTETGDLAEVADLGRRAYRSLRRITSHPRFCQNGVCTPETGCFYNTARRRAMDSQIVVVNHSLLLADLAISGEILPESEAIIIDEAHHLADVARQSLSIQLSRRETEEALREAGGLGEPGATDALRRLVRDLAPPVRRTEWMGSLRRIEEAVHRCHERTDFIFRGPQDPIPENGFRRRYRTADESPLPAAETEDLLGGLSEIGRGLSNLLESLEELAPAGERDNEQWNRVRTGIEEIRNSDAALRHLLSPDDPGRVYAYDHAPETGLVLKSIPLDIGEDLREKLFYQKQISVLTSATLAVGDSVEYMTRQVGLSPTDYMSAIYPSPFKMQEQVLSLGFKSGPNPNSKNFDTYVAEVVEKIVQKTPRKTLVLFTSRDLLSRVAEKLRSALPKMKILEQVRGGEEGAQLSESFRRSHRAVLLGTASFWEGVDFPGADLEILVLTRLPFAVPSDPLEEALTEEIQVSGGQAFQERSLPQAILKFRQGFGRLIRRRTDRGVFLVLDPRYCLSGYGPNFQKSLDVESRAMRSPDEAADAVYKWFAQDSSEGGTSS